jgi:hypothetical protein
MEITTTLGQYFEAWQRESGRPPAQLATYLGLAPDRLAELATEHVATESAGGVGESAESADATGLVPSVNDVERIGRRYGVNLDRLLSVVGVSDARTGTA